LVERALRWGWGGFASASWKLFFKADFFFTEQALR
jgi:hypothetical protein